MAFYRIEPFGTEVDLLGSAVTSSVVANVNRGKNKKPFKPEDFMPKFESENEKSVDEMIQFAAMMTVAAGGKDLRDDNFGNP